MVLKILQLSTVAPVNLLGFICLIHMLTQFMEKKKLTKCVCINFSNDSCSIKSTFLTQYAANQNIQVKSEVRQYKRNSFVSSLNRVWSPYFYLNVPTTFGHFGEGKQVINRADYQSSLVLLNKNVFLQA